MGSARAASDRPRPYRALEVAGARNAAALGPGARIRAAGIRAARTRSAPPDAIATVRARHGLATSRPTARTPRMGAMRPGPHATCGPAVGPPLRIAGVALRAGVSRGRPVAPQRRVQAARWATPPDRDPGVPRGGGAARSSRRPAPGSTAPSPGLRGCRVRPALRPTGPGSHDRHAAPALRPCAGRPEAAPARPPEELSGPRRSSSPAGDRSRRRSSRDGPRSGCSSSRSAARRSSRSSSTRRACGSRSSRSRAERSTSVAGFDGHQGVALVVGRARGRRSRTSWRGPRSAANRRSFSCSIRSRIRRTSARSCGAPRPWASHGVLFPTHRQAPISPAAVKASAGATEHLLLVPVDDLPAPSPTCTFAALRIVGADEDAPLTARQADLRGPVALVVGSEGQGIGPAVRRRIDLLVRIPMRGAGRFAQRGRRGLGAAVRASASAAAMPRRRHRRTAATDAVGRSIAAAAQAQSHRADGTSPECRPTTWPPNRSRPGALAGRRRRREGGASRAADERSPTVADRADSRDRPAEPTSGAFGRAAQRTVLKQAAGARCPRPGLRPRAAAHQPAVARGARAPKVRPRPRRRPVRGDARPSRIRRPQPRGRRAGRRRAARSRQPDGAPARHPRRKATDRRDAHAMRRGRRRPVEPDRRASDTARRATGTDHKAGRQAKACPRSRTTEATPTALSAANRRQSPPRHGYPRASTAATDRCRPPAGSDHDRRRAPQAASGLDQRACQAVAFDGVADLPAAARRRRPRSAVERTGTRAHRRAAYRRSFRLILTTGSAARAHVGRRLGSLDPPDRPAYHSRAPQALLRYGPCAPT